MKPCLIDGESLTLQDLYPLACRPGRVKLTSSARKKILSARRLVEDWIETGETIYGVTTGFGEFANVRISATEIEALQENLILSHAAGAGEPLQKEIVKAMMILRINALAKGFSGIRLETITLLVEMVNREIIPLIPSQGSVGASGDLVQLSHLVLAMMGKGRIWSNGKSIPSAVALKRHGLKPVRLKAKEGLALINGTQMMTAHAALAVVQALHLCRIADIAASIVSENKVLCHPGSVDSIPTSANQEDHNSMGSVSARKAWTVLTNAQTVIGIELYCACQGLDYALAMEKGKNYHTGKGVQAAYDHVRSVIPHLDADRVVYHDIQSALAVIKDQNILHAVERNVGTLE
ncbi:MAG: aromatic amino acid lyase [bacterium]